MATWSPPDQIHTHQQISLPFLFLQLYVTNNYNCHFKGSKLPFLIHLFYSQATLAVCVCETLKIIIINTREWKRERDKNSQRMWPFSRKGPSGFSSSSTAEDVTQGVDGTGLTAIVTGPFFFTPLNFDVIKNVGFVFYLIIVRWKNFANLFFLVMHEWIGSE